jgi:single-strand DNA-binding protein
MNEPIVTLVGNLSGEPELRLTPSGVPVCKFRMAQTPRVKDGEGYKDGTPFWINVTAWRNLGENCAETLKPGMRVIVQGRLEQRTYDHKDGHKVTVVDMTADAVGPDLTWSTAVVSKVNRTGGETGGRSAATATDDPWAGAAPAANRNAQGQPQAAAAPW